MPQTQCIPTEGLTEAALHLAAGIATGIKSTVCLKTACTADAAQTYAGMTKCTEAGFTLVNANSVTSTAAVITAYHTHTAGAVATLKGFIYCNDDDDAIYGICCYAADIPMEVTDTIKNTMTWTLSDVTA